MLKKVNIKKEFETSPIRKSSSSGREVLDKPHVASLSLCLTTGGKAPNSLPAIWEYFSGLLRQFGNCSKIFEMFSAEIFCMEVRVC